VESAGIALVLVAWFKDGHILVIFSFIEMRFEPEAIF
jgi:hypothetical protein